jgi:hypothetical protein
MVPSNGSDQIPTSHRLNNTWRIVPESKDQRASLSNAFASCAGWAWRTEAQRLQIALRRIKHTDCVLAAPRDTD